MENEENIGLIDKKASKDQLGSFFSHLWLSFYSLSLILLDTYIFLGALLEECGMIFIWSRKKGKVGKHKRTSE